MKKEWQKPELVCLSINADTENGNPGPAYDMVSYTTNAS